MSPAVEEDRARTCDRADTRESPVIDKSMASLHRRERELSDVVSLGGGILRVASRLGLGIGHFMHTARPSAPGGADPEGKQAGGSDPGQSQGHDSVHGSPPRWGSTVI